MSRYQFAWHDLYRFFLLIHVHIARRVSISPLFQLKGLDSEFWNRMTLIWAAVSSDLVLWVSQTIFLHQICIVTRLLVLTPCMIYSFSDFGVNSIITIKLCCFQPLSSLVTLSLSFNPSLLLVSTTFPHRCDFT